MALNEGRVGEDPLQANGTLVTAVEHWQQPHGALHARQAVML